jgi:hypothetical protein
MTFEQILSKLNSTFSGQASLAADTYAGKLNALAIASGNAKEIIGKGLVDAIGTAFGNGDIERATKNIEAMAASVADMVRGLGDVARLSGFNLLANVFGALRNKRNELATKDRVYDPRSGNMPDMSPAAMKIIQARKKADADAAKRQKELAALAQKQTKAIKEQTALQKAKAVIDKASAVMNMDLIQNTAALMGKVTEDETLRLKLQQAILLGNADAASKLSQELLTTQINAIILANIDPFGSFTSGAAAALKAMIELRNEMGTLTTPVLTRGEQLLAEDFLAAIQDQNDKSFDEAFEETKNFLDSLRNQPIGNMDLNYQDAFSRPNAGSGFTPTELRIFIDPTAAQYGIGVASVNNSANGNNNNYSTIQSFAGGM